MSVNRCRGLGLGGLGLEPTAPRWVLDCHVREAQHILVRQELEKLDFSQRSDGKLCDDDGLLTKDLRRARVRAEAIVGSPQRTHAVFLVVHDNLLERHDGAGLPCPCAMHLAKRSFA